MTVNPDSSSFHSPVFILQSSTMDRLSSLQTIRVAVTQAEPAWLDLQAGVQKTCKLIEEAARHGAQLVTFPECWIPGYPAWVWYGILPLPDSLLILCLQGLAALILIYKQFISKTPSGDTRQKWILSVQLLPRTK